MYEVSQLYLAKLSFYSNEFNEIRANIKDKDYLHMKYGERVKKFEIEDLNETKRKRILEEFFEGKDGMVLNAQLKQEVVDELKKKGLANKEYARDFTFHYVIKSCKDYDICDFIRSRVRKKDLSQNSKLKIGESCVIVKLKNKDK